MAGPYTLAEIRPMIPVHPQCRCVALPVLPDLGEEKKKPGPEPGPEPVVPGGSAKETVERMIRTGTYRRQDIVDAMVARGAKRDTVLMYLREGLETSKTSYWPYPRMIVVGPDGRLSFGGAVQAVKKIAPAVAKKVAPAKMAKPVAKAPARPTADSKHPSFIRNPQDAPAYARKVEWVKETEWWLDDAAAAKRQFELADEGLQKFRTWLELNTPYELLRDIYNLPGGALYRNYVGVGSSMDTLGAMARAGLGQSSARTKTLQAMREVLLDIQKERRLAHAVWVKNMTAEQVDEYRDSVVRKLLVKRADLTYDTGGKVIAKASDDDIGKIRDALLPRRWAGETGPLDWVPLDMLDDMSQAGFRISPFGKGRAFYGTVDRTSAIYRTYRGQNDVTKAWYHVEYSRAQLRKVIAHEWGHAIDDFFGLNTRGPGGLWLDNFYVSKADGDNFFRWFMKNTTGAKGTYDNGDGRYFVGKWFDNYEGHIYPQGGAGQEWVAMQTQRIQQTMASPANRAGDRWERVRERYPEFSNFLEQLFGDPTKGKDGLIRLASIDIAGDPEMVNEIRAASRAVSVVTAGR